MTNNELLQAVERLARAIPNVKWSVRDSDGKRRWIDFDQESGAVSLREPRREGDPRLKGARVPVRDIALLARDG